MLISSKGSNMILSIPNVKGVVRNCISRKHLSSYKNHGASLLGLPLLNSMQNITVGLNLKTSIETSFALTAFVRQILQTPSFLIVMMDGLKTIING